MNISLARRVVAEFLGTALLAATVIGSGIMADRLANGNLALVLLANTIATGAALVALILAFGGVSGAHFNPVVTLMDALEKGLPWIETPHYVVGQILGGIIGTVVAHLMFCTASGFVISAHSERPIASVQRVRSDVRIDFRDLGMLSPSVECCGVCCRCLHHGSLLVHGFYLVCKPCGHHCEVHQRYVCWHPAHRCSLVCNCPVLGWNYGDNGFSLASSQSTGWG
jgi:hypothetical protein